MGMIYIIVVVKKDCFEVIICLYFRFNNNVSSLFRFIVVIVNNEIVDKEYLNK